MTTSHTPQRAVMMCTSTSKKLVSAKVTRSGSVVRKELQDAVQNLLLGLMVLTLLYFRIYFDPFFIIVYLKIKCLMGKWNIVQCLYIQYIKYLIQLLIQMMCPPKYVSTCNSYSNVVQGSTKNINQCMQTHADAYSICNQIYIAYIHGSCK